MIARLRTALAVSAAAMMLAAAPIPAAAQAGGSLNFENADLAAVAQDVAGRTGRVFVVDPRVSGRVNIISPPGVSLTPDEIWEVFLATLQVNGFAAVPIGDREYKIVPAAAAVRSGQPGASGRTVTQVVALRNVDATTAATNLRGIASETSVVVPIAESNALVIVDTAASVQRLLSVVDRIDVDPSVVRRITLDNAAAGEVAQTLREIAARPGAGAAGDTISIVAIDSSNAVVLRGTPQQIARLLPVVEELDSPSRRQVALDTIYLDHADGSQIVPVIRSLLNEDVATTEDPDGGNAGPVRTSVAYHEPTNSLIVNAAPETQRLIRGIVSRLDIPRPQVLIEAVVVEISNNTARELGVQYVSGGGDLPLSAASFTGTSPNVVSAAGAALFLQEENNASGTTITTTAPDGTVTTTTSDNFDTNDPTIQVAGQLVEAAVTELLGFNGFLLGAGGETGSGGVYGVLLSAIQSDGQSNVLQVPSTVVLDNETAELSVGQEIPIVTGEAIGSDFQGGFRQIERKDVGTILQVTPQINDGNTMTLEISLEVSSIGAFASIANGGIITNESVARTVANAEDGQTLVIGGLINNDRRDTESKVPVLGDVPLLGNLFKGQSSAENEKTLMIFIRPTILRNGTAANSVTARKYDFVRQQQLRRSRDGTARIDGVMQDYVGPAAGYTPEPVTPRGTPAIEDPDGAE